MSSATEPRVVHLTVGEEVRVSVRDADRDGVITVSDGGGQATRLHLPRGVDELLFVAKVGALVPHG